MVIHIDIRGFLRIHVWICYRFSYQGYVEDIRSQIALVT